MGADCFSLTRYKETPKDMAMRYGHPQCVELLAMYGELKLTASCVTRPPPSKYF